TLAEEIDSWYMTYYTPLRISDYDAKQLGIDRVASKIHSTTSWPHPDWGPIIQTGPSQTPSVGEITVFLRGFILGQSRWSARLSHRNRLSDTIETLSVEPTCYLTSGGLVL